jgi:methyl-accepting chemotaxis protein
MNPLLRSFILIPLINGLLAGLAAAAAVIFFQDQPKPWLAPVLALLTALLVTGFFFSREISRFIRALSEALQSTGIGISNDNPLTEPLRNELSSISGRITLLKTHHKTFAQAIGSELEALRSSLGTEDLSAFIRERLMELNQGFQNAVDSLREINKVNESMVQNTQSVAQSTQEMSQDARKTSQTATQGIRSVGNEIKAMSDLKLTVGSSTNIINELSEMSNHVGKFVTTISNISRRTQLLALNAGIEAARAGESGRGFSVVAAEIRTLSESSKLAAEEIEKLITEINVRTASVMEILKNTSKLEETIKVVYTAGDTFMSIVREIKAIESVVNRVSSVTTQATQDSQSMGELLQKFTMQYNQSQQMLHQLNDLAQHAQNSNAWQPCYDKMARLIQENQAALANNPAREANTKE